jgi:hypothetical protein
LTTSDRPPLAGAHHDADQPRSLQALVDELEQLTDHERVSLLEIVHHCGATSFAPVLLVIGLMVMSPLSGIPLFSSFSGTLIAVVSLQMLLQHENVWLPGFVGRRSVPGHRLRSALGFMRRIADFFDRFTRANRLQQLVGRRGRIVTQGLCVVAGAAMPVFEIVPFSSSVLAAAVVCFSLSLLTRDGLLTVIGVAILSLVLVLPPVAVSTAVDIDPASS